jgi:hypothetical protein
MPRWCGAAGSAAGIGYGWATKLERPACGGGRAATRSASRAAVASTAHRRRHPMATSGRPTLYERLGGVYSIAAVVDDLIDRVMNDPRLNANPRVDEAHHRVSAAGFKFLVTELVCWASGGPQQYSGRSMRDGRVGRLPGRLAADIRQVCGPASRAGGAESDCGEHARGDRRVRANVLLTSASSVIDFSPTTCERWRHSPAAPASSRHTRSTCHARSASRCIGV